MVHGRITHETVVHSPRSISPSELDLVTDQSIKGISYGKYSLIIEISILLHRQMGQC